MQSAFKNWNWWTGGLITATVLMASLWPDLTSTRTTQSITAAQSVRDGAQALVISLLITFIFKIDQYRSLLEAKGRLIDEFLVAVQYNRKLERITKHIADCAGKKDAFYQFFVDVAIDESANKVNKISQGRFECDPESELKITKEILKICNKSLKAISFQDEDWWNSHDGTLYLATHKKHLTDDGDKACRIFLVEKSKHGSLLTTLEEHKKLKIQTYILYLDEDAVPDKYRLDFVIYDDKLVRHASLINPAIVGKKAVFTTDTEEISLFNSHFEDLLVLAKKKNRDILKP